MTEEKLDWREKKQRNIFSFILSAGLYQALVRIS